MNRIVLTLLLLAPITVLAQNPAGMNQADMQNMMQQMQQAQACMEKIDQAEMQSLKNKSEQFQSEMKSLCSSGERDKAQDKAMAYAKELVNNPAVNEMKRCGEMMQGAMKGMMPNMASMNTDTDYTKHHVCDSF